jgi:hypothetical protein
MDDRPLSAEPEFVDGYRVTPFNELADYIYEIPSDEEIEQGKFPDQIPAKIRALNGKKVVVEGFMIPSFMEWGPKVKTFILVANQMSCCYGMVPAMNEWVEG